MVDGPGVEDCLGCVVDAGPDIDVDNCSGGIAARPG